MYRLSRSRVVVPNIARVTATATTTRQQQRGASSTKKKNRAPPQALRRKRTGFTSIPETPVRTQLLGLSEAYRPNEENVDDYLAKASLSPWVPLPDAACRALVDLVQMNENDRHVDLGSGDGRVNFWAADQAHVEWTMGVDVDEGILALAEERLAKRHPRPANIEFVQADLLQDQDHAVWDKIRQATVISMFFATPALHLFRPLLEEQLRGHSCKIVTASYPMPGWEPWQTTVVLGITLHYYKWGEEWEDEMDDEDMSFFLADDLILPEEQRNALETDRFRGSKVIDRTTGRNPFKQHMQNLAQEDTEDDDLFEDDEEEEEEKTEEGDKVTVEQVKSSS